MRNILLLSVAFIFCNLAAFAQNTRQREIDAFIAQTGAIATTDKATNSLNFLRFPIESPLQLPGSSPQEKVLSFMSTYSNLFEKRTDKDSYLVKENKRDNYGLDHVTLQQYYDRVPIFDGVLKFHFNKVGGLTSLNGNFIIAEKLNAIPSISREDAGQQAIKLVTGQKIGKVSAPLKINKNTLLVFQKGLAQGYKGPLHLVYEVEVRNDADVREFMYIDAHSKELVEQFTGMHGIDRKLYETSISAPNLKWEEADGIPSAKFTALDQWQKSEIESAGHMYNLMKNAFGHNSYNNAAAAMVTINNNPNVGCPNANWNGISANYCTGVASDDIVAHEWAHAYTEHTSGLIYAWQAGALNEAYSDIWGETVDQLNGYFDGGESDALRNGCASSARWRIGEQASAFGGAIRDMWDPTCGNSPGKISDPQYWCSINDYGGVHTNSGILNHAYALLVDGGIYNGQLINGLGLTKSAHIFWNAQATKISATTDFAALADILEASLIELIDVNLPKLSTDNLNSALSGFKIAPTDLEELEHVIQAVEMRIDNSCGFQTLFKPVDPLCQGALQNNAIFFENFENGLEAWSVSNSGNSPSWISRNWIIDDTPPSGRAGKVAFADDLNTESCFSSPQNGIMSLFSPAISIPAESNAPLMMAFDHVISLERSWDGGNIKYQIDGSAWQLVPKTAFVDNGYNMFLDLTNNPMAGQPAFTGSDEGSQTSEWGQSRINLSSLGVVSGQTIKFRWDLGSDACNGWDGWYIDNVIIYSCTTPMVQFISPSSSVSEEDAITANSDPYSCLSYIDKIVTVKISEEPAMPVTITMKCTTGTAPQGIVADYVIIPESFVLGAGSLSKDVIVRVYDDAYVEGSETFTLSYDLTNAVGGNAIAGSILQNHNITIIDNDFAPTSISGTEVFKENFNDHSLPANWKATGSGYPKSWAVVDFGAGFALDPNGHPYLGIDGYQSEGQLDENVETNTFNAIGMASINLSFLQYFSVQSNDTDAQAIVDVWNGNVWQTILIQNKDTGVSGSWNAPADINLTIPISAASKAMKFRFRYIVKQKYLTNFWGLDNVKVTGTYHTKIKSDLSVTPDQKYLGPNAAVYFYDPISGDLIAKIKNLTAHDYGCTSVQVDRAGTDGTAWVGPNKITKKTFKVTPTYNNVNGKYEITLYYDTSELPDFNGTAIKSMGKSEGSIQQATAANSVTAPVQMTMFNNGYAYTATFNSGFSGFGLSDASSGEALPVNFSRFEGKHTSEGNILLWETATEINNDHFIAYRSIDAKTFIEIAKIKGVGNSAIVNNYSFNDNQFPSGLNYYRLKQVDKDGTFTYSRTIAIDSPEKSRVKYFPNPVQSSVEIELPDNAMKFCNVKIFNSAGQCVLIKDKIIVTNSKTSLDLAKLPAGFYLVVITGEINTYNFSIVKIPQ